ncbi:TPA: hypothetical protein DF272_05150 [Candidatus Falkowbacteria bacterium]|nr:hypothetical protein [Candidatus Falkowbacteria bacterium]
MSYKSKIKIFVISLIILLLGLILYFYLWPVYCAKDQYENLDCPFLCQTKSIGGYDAVNDLDWIGKQCVPSR